MTGSKRTNQRGFALLVAIVLSAVAAGVTLALTTLAYKSLVLSSAVQESQYAFYGADTALECALYWDNSAHLAFAYHADSVNGSPKCEGKTLNFSVHTNVGNGVTEFQSEWYDLASGAGCFRITVDKQSDGHASLYGDAVSNTTCSAGSLPSTLNPRATERGIKATY
jgi:hypothetical protein